MAIWQVSVFLVKKEKKYNSSGINLWNTLDELIEIFPEEKSWCDSIRQFGRLDSTCMEIDIEDEEILLRIDLRNITKEQLEIIIRFADSNGLKIKHENKVEEPTFRNLINIFKTSDAYRFLNNPERYLKSIATDV